MKIIPIHTAIVIVALSVSACGGGAGVKQDLFLKYSPINQGASPKNVASIEVFITKKPTKEYRELGIASYTEWDSTKDEISAIDKLKALAASKGGDALILLDTQSDVSTNYATKQSYQGRIFRSMVIDYVGK